MNNKYVDSKTILQSILQYEQQAPYGMNGFILLVHIGVDPRRTDKFYFQLPALIATLKKRGYGFSKLAGLVD